MNNRFTQEFFDLIVHWARLASRIPTGFGFIESRFGYTQ